MGGSRPSPPFHDGGDGQGFGQCNDRPEEELEADQGEGFAELIQGCEKLLEKL